jgi:hypothetical protein
MSEAPSGPSRLLVATRRLRPALLLGLALAATVGLVYARFLWSPETFFIGDLVSLFQPLRHLFREALSAGDLPLWTPAFFAGTPVVADPQAAVFYPGTYLHLIGGYPTMELVSFLLHLLLAGAGMAWLARTLGIGWAGAAYAALASSLGGFFIVHLVHPNFVHTAAWLPWVLGATRRVVETGRLRNLALTAAFTALMLLAGGIQLAYYGAAAVSVVGVTTVATLPATWPLRARRLTLLLGALALGVIAALVQLWPTAEFTALSVRAEGVTAELAGTYHVPVRSLITLLVPYAFGLPGRTPFVGGGDPYEILGYAGALTIPLALTAVLRRPTALRLAFAALGLLAALASLGPDAPGDLTTWLWRYAPGFDRFRAHGRLVFLVVVCLVTLAAWGLDELLSDDEPGRARHAFLAALALALGAAAAVVLVGAGASPLLPEPVAATAVRSAGGVTLVLLAAAAVLLVSCRVGARRAVFIAAGLLSLHGLDLIAAGQALAADRQPPPATDVARRNHRLPAAIRAAVGREHRVLHGADSYYMLQNLGAIEGYDNLRAYGPMMLRRTYDLLHLADTGRFPAWRRLPVDQNLISVQRTDSPVLRLLGVRVVLHHDYPSTGPLHFRSITLPDPLPRAFVVYRTEHLPRAADQAAFLTRIDPGEAACVETPAAMVPEGPLRPATAVSLRGRSASGSHVRLHARADQPGLLVFTESWHPGWRALVDGRETGVHCVDHGLVGVRLAPGEHDVVLDFAPASLRRGALCSAGAWLLLLGLGVGPAIYARLRTERRTQP